MCPNDFTLFMNGIVFHSVNHGCRYADGLFSILKPFVSKLPAAIYIEVGCWYLP